MRRGPRRLGLEARLQSAPTSAKRGHTFQRLFERIGVMAFVCEYCSKNRLKAHKVSHSNVKTRKWQQPNLQSVRVVKDGRSQKVLACTRCIRTGVVIKAA